MCQMDVWKYDKVMLNNSWQQKIIHLLIYSSILLVYRSEIPMWGSSDTLPNKYLPISILLQGNINLNEFPQIVSNNSYNVCHYQGNIRSCYPLVTPILALPVYLGGVWAGLPLDDDIVVDALGRLSSDIIAWLAVIIFHQALLKITAPLPALLSCLSLAFGSSVWSTASTDLWQHSGSILFLCLSIWCWCCGRINPDGYWMTAFGFCMALATLARPTNGGLLIISIVVIVMQKYNWKRVLKSMIPAGIILSVGVIVNIYLYGNWMGGYQLHHQNLGWFAPQFRILANIYLHPSRGLFIYSPVFIIGIPILLTQAVKHAAWEIEWASWMIITHSIILSSWIIWDGGINYGPRLMTEIVPFWAILCIPYWSMSGKKVSLFILGILLLSLSIAIHTFGTFKFNGTYFYRDSKGWKCSEIAYTITKHMCDIPHIRDPECFAVNENIDLNDGAYKQLKILGWNGCTIGQTAEIWMKPEHETIYSLALGGLIHENIFASPEQLIVELDGNQIAKIPISPGKEFSRHILIPCAIQSPRDDSWLGVRKLRFEVKYEFTRFASFLPGQNVRNLELVEIEYISIW